MPEPTHRITPIPLSSSAWAPFGWVPVNDTDPEDASHRLSFEWGDPHVNVIGHARAEVSSMPGGLLCEEMFRHLTHTQVLMPLDNRCVMAVAAPGHDFDRIEAGDDKVTAFVLEPLQAVVLHPGTWHWGPYPTSAPGVRLFNIQGFRYEEDNERVDLADRGFEVLTG